MTAVSQSFDDSIDSLIKMAHLSEEIKSSVQSLDVQFDGKLEHILDNISADMASHVEAKSRSYLLVPFIPTTILMFMHPVYLPLLIPKGIGLLNSLKNPKKYLDASLNKLIGNHDDEIMQDYYAGIDTANKTLKSNQGQYIMMQPLYDAVDDVQLKHALTYHVTLNMLRKLDSLKKDNEAKWKNVVKWFDLLPAHLITGQLGAGIIKDVDEKSLASRIYDQDGKSSQVQKVGAYQLPDPVEKQNLFQRMFTPAVKVVGGILLVVTGTYLLSKLYDNITQKD
jgi:hypothetical protein